MASAIAASLMRRAGSASTFASLWARAVAAISGDVTCAARTPGTLFAAIATPTPLPQRRSPESARPFATASPTANATSG